MINVLILWIVSLKQILKEGMVKNKRPLKQGEITKTQGRDEKERKKGGEKGRGSQKRK